MDYYILFVFSGVTRSSLRVFCAILISLSLLVVLGFSHASLVDVDDTSSAEGGSSSCTLLSSSNLGAFYFFVNFFSGEGEAATLDSSLLDA